jgi:IS30 family transposase
MSKHYLTISERENITQMLANQHSSDEIAR